MKKTKIKTSSTSVPIPNRLFFRIRDVAKLAGVKPHVLRYWEKEFPVISPEKTDSGHRVYRRRDVENVLLIKQLLHVERYSIAGARKRLSGAEAKEVIEDRQGPGGSSLESSLRDLQALVQVPMTTFFQY
jgi:DNA-binding transcriptional MerR regulator